MNVFLIHHPSSHSTAVRILQTNFTLLWFASYVETHWAQWPNTLHAEYKYLFPNHKCKGEGCVLLCYHEI